MCRIAAYLGPPLSLGAFMRAPHHSLYKQSWAAKELVTATVNADGYGVAWLGENGQPAVYKNIMPVWADPNLTHLERNLRSRVWLGNVRSATEGLSTHMNNTQPFLSGQWLFTHNGFIENFSVDTRRAIRAQLDPEIEADIQGTTDSEYLFALIRQQRASMTSSLRNTYEWLKTHLSDKSTKALLNIIISDGTSLVALRAAINAPCPSLYYHAQHSGLENGVVVASERFDDDPEWIDFPEQHLLRLAPGQAAEIEAL